MYSIMKKNSKFYLKYIFIPNDIFKGEIGEIGGKETPLSP